MDTQQLGRSIRLSRKARGLGLADVADWVGRSTKTIGLWERGANAGAWDFIPRLEELLGPLTGLPDQEPSIPAVLAQLRAAAQALDVAREMLHALEPPVG